MLASSDFVVVVSVVGFVGELLEVVGGSVVVVTIGSMRKMG